MGGNKKDRSGLIQVELGDKLKTDYYEKCEAHFGVQRRSHIPIKKFIRDFINGRIYIVDGVLHIREKK